MPRDARNVRLPGSSIQRILTKHLDPLGCGRLQVEKYYKHRFATFPTLEERSRFRNDEIKVDPETLAKAGFYYAEDDMINCCGCPTSIHSTLFLSQVNQFSQHPENIQPWHKKQYDYCKFAIDLGGSNCLREDCRLASLLRAQWRNPALWQNMSSNVFNMARSGFFYSENQRNNENEDAVVCFSCNTVVQDWENDDTPDKEHLRLFPECPYLNARTEKNLAVAGNIPIHTVDPIASTDVGTGSKTESDSAENDSCLYPVCKDKIYRERSFLATWPHSGLLAPSAMAAAGFFYVNNLKDDGDRVACYNCGVAAESWIEGDDPAEFHTRSSPSCNFAV